MYSVEDKIRFIQKTSEAVLADLKVAPEKSTISNLLRACEAVDQRFQEFCAEFDQQDGLEPGTTYREGVPPMEFYIESSDWEEISLELRKLRPKEDQ